MLAALLALASAAGCIEGPPAADGWAQASAGPFRLYYPVEEADLFRGLAPELERIVSQLSSQSGIQPRQPWSIYAYTPLVRLEGPHGRLPLGLAHAELKERTIYLPLWPASYSGFPPRDAEFAGVMAHEVVHAYQAEVVPPANLPAWVAEGSATEPTLPRDVQDMPFEVLEAAQQVRASPPRATFAATIHGSGASEYAAGALAARFLSHTCRPERPMWQVLAQAEASGTTHELWAACGAEEASLVREWLAWLAPYADALPAASPPGRVVSRLGTGDVILDACPGVGGWWVLAWSGGETAVTWRWAGDEHHARARTPEGLLPSGLACLPGGAALVLGGERGEWSLHLLRADGPSERLRGGLPRPLSALSLQGNRSVHYLASGTEGIGLVEVPLSATGALGFVPRFAPGRLAFASDGSRVAYALDDGHAGRGVLAEGGLPGVVLAVRPGFHPSHVEMDAVWGASHDEVVPCLLAWGIGRPDGEMARMSAHLGPFPWEGGAAVVATLPGGLAVATVPPDEGCA